MIKTILITGASRGIGRATALKAGAMGWNVAVNYVNDADAAEAVAAKVMESGALAIAVKADIASETDVERMFTQSIESIGPLDGVVINAGIVAPASTLAEMSIERLRRMVDVNVMGTLLTARGAARALSQTGKPGSIVIVSSAASRLGSAGEYVDYAACKGAADTLTIGLSRELGPKGIRVNAVRPAFIETEIHASGGRPDRAGVLGATTPMGRSGQPEEVADAITWLISDASSYVTGTFVDMSGGR
ncbi:SDR family oxidoreductase [Shinella sp.]|uniref:SDR family oxidoreductase n=1 Tax=Shinella sp. TaxID=1870904 RepID=UPI002586E617|nr:SDR family oxidoreductase [Shinella sp.]MCW5711967.1 SDR family oxidoreductase [Shinella sp.]